MLATLVRAPRLILEAQHFELGGVPLRLVRLGGDCNAPDPCHQITSVFTLRNENMLETIAFVDIYRESNDFGASLVMTDFVTPFQQLYRSPIAPFW